MRKAYSLETRKLMFLFDRILLHLKIANGNGEEKTKKDELISAIEDLTLLRDLNKSIYPYVSYGIQGVFITINKRIDKVLTCLNHRDLAKGQMIVKKWRKSLNVLG